MTSPYSQSGYRVGFDWGPVGAAAVPGALVAVVDVLSFTTSVTVAADRGIAVLPYRWRDDTARQYAEQHAAALAVGRSEAGPDGISLSPVSIRQAGDVQRLVLPSPNGSTISQQLADSGSTVLAVCLRNASAAADWIAARVAAAGANASVGSHAVNSVHGADAADSVRADAAVRPAVVAIAAGERWPDGSLRPAVEDLWGAGAFLAALADRGVGPLSPEARAVAAAYRDIADELPKLLHDCAGGRELTQYGFPQDVAIAAEVDSSSAVPVLRGLAFTVD
ncbi:putative lipoprotein [Kribbella flavida DSM 17836]|uniref:Probable 2-phosphosulfolactate phosphatase n=1 Tax=Kribbella flavida (strain DSM 17836 / JCM 10339 / NBRC 14399) TaxID=479435 RepID=D2Q104_KRIFD|nr:2-phosphosulfolactate phosphatase [Kribbella flavida]ADB35705.1 putative lipoprotein [Kribbella flavida DSM 17836]